jgi:hypothetical protein
MCWKLTCDVVVYWSLQSFIDRVCGRWHKIFVFFFCENFFQDYFLEHQNAGLCVCMKELIRSRMRERVHVHGSAIFFGCMVCVFMYAEEHVVVADM